MKRQKGKPKNQYNDLTNEQKISCTSGNDKELENRVISQMEEFEQKTQLGRKLRLIVYEHNCDVNGLEKDKNTLDIHELYGKNGYETLNEEVGNVI